jgi:hypothetical protein
VPNVETQNLVAAPRLADGRSFNGHRGHRAQSNHPVAIRIHDLLAAMGRPALGMRIRDLDVYFSTTAARALHLGRRLHLTYLTLLNIAVLINVNYDLILIFRS